MFGLHILLPEFLYDCLTNCYICFSLYMFVYIFTIFSVAGDYESNLEQFVDSLTQILEKLKLLAPS